MVQDDLSALSDRVPSQMAQIQRSNTRLFEIERLQGYRDSKGFTNYNSQYFQENFDIGIESMAHLKNHLKNDFHQPACLRITNHQRDIECLLFNSLFQSNFLLSQSSFYACEEIFESIFQKEYHNLYKAKYADVLKYRLPEVVIFTQCYSATQNNHGYKVKIKSIQDHEYVSIISFTFSQMEPKQGSDFETKFFEQNTSYLFNDIFENYQSCDHKEQLQEFTWAGNFETLRDGTHDPCILFLLYQKYV